MDPLLTQDQNRQLASWASQRDAILRDIGDRKTENEGLTKANRDLADSNTEISNRIQQSIGRLEELDRREASRAALTTVENENLTREKSILQTEVSSLRSMISTLAGEYVDIREKTESITKVYETVFSKAGDIERIIEGTVRMSSSNASEVKAVLEAAAAQMTKIVEIGRKAVDESNQTIGKIPQMMVDIHKDVIERRTISRNKIKRT